MAKHLSDASIFFVEMCRWYSLEWEAHRTGGFVNIDLYHCGDDCEQVRSSITSEYLAHDLLGCVMHAQTLPVLDSRCTGV